MQVDSGLAYDKQQRRYPAISRISTDNYSSKVRVSYPRLNQFGRQEIMILNIDVEEFQHIKSQPGHKDEDPLKTVTWETRVKTVSLATIVRPKLIDRHSISLGTFIDPDYVNFPPGFSSNTAMFYWLEYPSAQSPRDDEINARYCIVEGENFRTSPANLSVNDGNPRSWFREGSPGHYLTGGFFLYGNSLNYVPQWVEQGNGIRANIVTVRT